MAEYFSHNPLVRENAIERRLYQEVIAASALKKGNTLVVLPTALGKTAIAALVAAERLRGLPGPAVVICPTKPLAEQHAKTLSAFLDVPVAVVTGEIPPSERAASYCGARMICCTAPVLRNDVITGNFDLSDTVLAVFDEAHHCVKNDSYVFLAREYMNRAKNPLILALTASPGHTSEKVGEICRNLFISNVESRSESDGDVLPYVSKVDTQFVEVPLPAEFLRVKELLLSVLRAYLRGLKASGLIESADVAFVTKRDILSAKGRAASLRDFASIAATAGAMKILHAIELLETQGVFSLVEFLERLRKDGSASSRQIMQLEDFRQALAITRHLHSKGVDHPKLARLIEIVKGAGSSPVIVFAHYRAQARKLAAALESSGVSAREFLGQKEGFTQKKQKETIEAFRRGDFSALVSTSVGEEGIDIPAVDTIVFYEPVPSAIRHIQRRGRTGRKAGEGRVAILVAKGSKDEAYRWISHRNEKAMRNIMRSVKLAKREEESANRSLSSFISPSAHEEEGEDEPRPRILVDTREAGSSVLSLLKSLSNVSVEMKPLPVADIVISDSVAIERKTGEDFVASLLDGRLFDQAAQLSDTFDRPLMIVEAESLSKIYAKRNIHPNAIRGALASISLDFGIPVIFVRDKEEGAALISVILRRETDPKRPPQVKGKLRGKTLPEQQEGVVAALPDVNLTLARRLLSHFGSPQAVFCAGPEELRKVGGIGKVTAAKIRKVASGREDEPAEPAGEKR